MPPFLDAGVGTEIQFRILSTHPRLHLHLLSQTSDGSKDSTPSSLAARFLGAAGLSSGAGDLAQAFVTTLRTLSPPLLRLLAPVFERLLAGRSVTPRERRRVGRAILELGDRGMRADGDGHHDLDAGFLGQLAGLIPFQSQNDTSSQQEPQTPSGDQIASYLRRVAPRADSPVQLFNYLSDHGELHWILVPVGALRGPAAVSGSLRVGLHRGTGTPQRAALRLAVAGGTWWFHWTISGGAAELSAAWEEESAVSIPESLLARLGGTGHTGESLEIRDDGFDLGVGVDPGEGVDAYG
jgi:hypothetical protein